MFVSQQSSTWPFKNQGISILRGKFAYFFRHCKQCKKKKKVPNVFAKKQRHGWPQRRTEAAISWSIWSDRYSVGSNGKGKAALSRTSCIPLVQTLSTLTFQIASPPIQLCLPFWYTVIPRPEKPALFAIYSLPQSHGSNGPMSTASSVTHLECCSNTLWMNGAVGRHRGITSSPPLRASTIWTTSYVSWKREYLSIRTARKWSATRKLDTWWVRYLIVQANAFALPLC